MSEKINLTELRAEAERFAELHHYDPDVPETIPPLSTLSVDEVLALVEAVEAARDAWRQVYPNGNDRFQVAAHDKLRDALARFDFEVAS